MPNTPEFSQFLNDNVITRYGLDKTAQHPDNLIEHEVHDLLKPDGSFNKAIAPREGAFYTADIELVDITDPANPRPLVKATRDAADGSIVKNAAFDYICIEPSMVVGSLTGKEACYVIVFPGDNNPPQKVELRYQVVGGQFMHTSAVLLDVYERMAKDYVNWDDIANKPSMFNGAHHGHSLDDTYGWEYVVEAIDRLGRIMELGHIPSYVEMSKKICEITAKATKPLVKLNHMDLFDGLPSDEYLTKNDLMYIFKKIATDKTHDDFYNKTFESSFNKLTGEYRHAVMTEKAVGSYWKANDIFNIEYEILNKETGHKRVKLSAINAVLGSLPYDGGEARVILKDPDVVYSNDLDKEVVVSIAIYHHTIPGRNLCIHYDAREVNIHNYKLIPPQASNVKSYIWQKDQVEIRWKYETGAPGQPDIRHAVGETVIVTMNNDAPQSIVVGTDGFVDLEINGRLGQLTIAWAINPAIKYETVITPLTELPSIINLDDYADYSSLTAVLTTPGGTPLSSVNGIDIAIGNSPGDNVIDYSVTSAGTGAVYIKECMAGQWVTVSKVSSPYIAPVSVQVPTPGSGTFIIEVVV